MHNEPIVPQDMFRSAMRGVPGVVVVATAQDAKGCYAVTLSSMTSLSLDPPSLLISINRSSSLYGAIERGSRFCINILRHGHSDLARICGDPRQRDSRNDSGVFETVDGIPCMTDAQANIFCVQNGRHLYASHAIVIGKATRIRLSDRVDPLIYLNGQFGTFAPLAEA